MCVYDIYLYVAQQEGGTATNIEEHFDRTQQIAQNTEDSKQAEAVTDTVATENVGGAWVGGAYVPDDRGTHSYLALLCSEFLEIKNHIGFSDIEESTFQKSFTLSVNTVITVFVL